MDREGLFRTLVTARALEEVIAAVQPYYHSGFGMEAVGVGVCSALGDDDFLVNHYRGIGAPLAKGMAPFDLMTSYLLKATSPVRGRLWHPVDVGRGLFGSMGTSGSEFGRAAGLALAAKSLRPGAVAVGMFGDGAAQRGTMHEAFLMASAWSLPVLWVCENNEWSISTRADRIFPGDIADLASGYHFESEIVDGNDVFAVRDASDAFIDELRAGARPAFLECRTYRVRSHMEAEGADYQPAEEVDRWRVRDPIDVARRRLETEGVATERLDAIAAEARAEVDDARRRAEDEPNAVPEDDPTSGLYAS